MRAGNWRAFWRYNGAKRHRDRLVLTARAAEIPNDVSRERLTVSDLPRDWRKLDHPLLRDLGTNWLQHRRSAILIVPSALLPHENNWLLNPAHPDFTRVRVRKSERFSFDPRMWK